MGRLPIAVAVDPLTRTPIDILTKPKNALIKQYQKLLKMDGIEAEFEEEAIRALAKKAIEIKTGARGLRSILEKAMMRLMYELPSDKSVKKVIITKEMILNKLDPIIVRENAKREIAS